MHYFAGVIIPKFVVDAGEEEIKKAVANYMAPFDQELVANPHKVYLDEHDLQNITAYCNIDADNIDGIVDSVEEYFGEKGFRDEEGIYYISTVNEDMKWDWYVIGGRWHGVIAGNPLDEDQYRDRIDGNITTVDDLLQRIEEDQTYPPYTLVTPEGEWHEKGWDRKDEKERVEEVCKVLLQYTGHYIVGVDYHM